MISSIRSRNQTLFEPIVSRRIGPGFRKALGQSEQALPVGHRLSAPFALELFQPAIEFSHPSQRLVPAPLKGLRHEPVLRLNRVVLALGAGGLVAGLFKLKRERVQDLVSLCGGVLGVIERGFDRARSKHAQHFAFNRAIDSEAAE